MSRQTEWLFEAPVVLEDNRPGRLTSNLEDYSNPKKNYKTQWIALRSPRFRDDSRLQKAANNAPPLRKGERGTAVQKLQRALIDLGFPMPITVKRGTAPPDGIYGNETVTTVKKFQAKHGLKVDGIAGKETLRLLDRSFSRGRAPLDGQLTCGVPRSTVQYELELERELADLEAPTKAQKVYPRLCLYQNASQTIDRNHFHCGATRWANRVSAYAPPSASRVGATIYNTGADIISAIETTQKNLKRPVEIVHIFSHSGPHGIAGAVFDRQLGLYYSALLSPDQQSRQDGARVITDIPTSSLAQNVIFVLHGCNTASGTDNFAKALYNHLASALDNPRVYGHYNTGCSSRNNSWREYSKLSPSGKDNPTSISSYYQDVGCCKKPK